MCSFFSYFISLTFVAVSVQDEASTRGSLCSTAQCVLLSVGCDSSILFPSAVYRAACQEKRSVFKLMFHIKAIARCGANNIPLDLM